MGEVTAAGGTTSETGSNPGRIEHYSSETCQYRNGYNALIEGYINTYNNSGVKSVVDAWAQVKFTDELKTVGGYSARLITYDEYMVNCEEVEITTPTAPRTAVRPKYDWMYNNQNIYWTMSYEYSSQDVWYVGNGHLSAGSSSYVDYKELVVRSLINVYKDKISS